MIFFARQRKSTFNKTRAFLFSFLLFLSVIFLFLFLAGCARELSGEEERIEKAGEDLSKKSLVLLVALQNKNVESIVQKIILTVGHGAKKTKKLAHSLAFRVF